MGFFRGFGHHFLIDFFLISWNIITESKAKYNEGEVNIHYKTPIRREEKEFIPEDELRKRQEDQVQRILLIFCKNLYIFLV